MICTEGTKENQALKVFAVEESALDYGEEKLKRADRPLTSQLI